MDDPLVWTAPLGDLPEMSWDELNIRVGRLALAAFATTLYPGNPHASGADSATAEQMVIEVARLSDDPVDRAGLDLDHAGEGLPEMLAAVGLEVVERVVRPWLGLEPEEYVQSGEDAAVGRETVDHGVHEPGAIDADQLARLLEIFVDHVDFAIWNARKNNFVRGAPPLEFHPPR